MKITQTLIGLCLLGACGAKIEGGDVKPAESSVTAGHEASGAADAKFIRCANAWTEVYVDMSNANLTQQSFGRVRVGSRSLNPLDNTFDVETVDASAVTKVNDSTTLSFDVQGAKATQTDIDTKNFVTGSGSFNHGSQLDGLACAFLKDNIYAGKAGW